MSGRKEHVMQTPRLHLRQWREEDLPAFAAMNADERVMEFMPKVLSRAESDALAGRIREHFERHGFGLWAVEVVRWENQPSPESSPCEGRGDTARTTAHLAASPPRNTAGEFIGFVGLSVPQFHAHFTPCVEVGWRLVYEHWGKGYATEGARAAIDFGFNKLRLDEIVSFTVPENLRSIRVMERLGMTRSAADDFEHPRLPEGHRLRRHVLYRLRQAAKCHPSP